MSFNDTESLPESSSEKETNKTDCLICEFSGKDLKQLKTHLLLKHSELNLCLFCVEKKGWSDTFSSGATYNEHYWKVHKGVIQKNEKKRSDAKEKRKSVIKKWRSECDRAVSEGLTPPKRPCPKLICTLCKDTPEFTAGTEFDRHFLVHHQFDYCKLCHQMNRLPAVRRHIISRHPTELCFICCGTSPVFNDPNSLDFHLSNKHGLKTKLVANNEDSICVTDYPCLDCPDVIRFSSLELLKDHLESSVHSFSENSLSLRPMMSRKKYFEIDNESESRSSDDTLLPPVTRVCGVRNETGDDCFAIAVLHLLAQTELVQRLTAKDHHSNCLSPSCLLAHFLEEYHNHKKRFMSSRPFVDNFKQFGITSLPVDCGDFLRSLLSAVCADPPEHATEKEDIKPLFRISLEWKFVCTKCKRCSVVSLQDYVLRIDGTSPDSLERLLNKFLHQRQCRCGQLCQVYPGVRSAGNLLLLEIDRAVLSDPKNDNNDGQDNEEVKELSVYSLQLNNTYNIFGFSYALVGTVSYKVDSDDGGHYVTYLFPNKNELIRLHETEVKTIKRLPDFDVTTVLVALKRIDVTAKDLRRIELEIEFEPVATTSQDDSGRNVSFSKELQPSEIDEEGPAENAQGCGSAEKVTRKRVNSLNIFPR